MKRLDPFPISYFQTKGIGNGDRKWEMEKWRTGNRERENSAAFRSIRYFQFPISKQKELRMGNGEPENIAAFRSIPYFQFPITKKGNLKQITDNRQLTAKLSIPY